MINCGISRWDDPDVINAKLKELTSQPIWEVSDNYYEGEVLPYFEEKCKASKAVYEEAKRQGRDDLINQVDGGINPETIALASAAGADCFVAGSAVFDKPDYTEAISGLRGAAQANVRA